MSQDDLAENQSSLLHVFRLNHISRFFFQSTNFKITTLFPFRQKATKPKAQKKQKSKSKATCSTARGAERRSSPKPDIASKHSTIGWAAQEGRRQVSLQKAIQVVLIDKVLGGLVESVSKPYLDGLGRRFQSPGDSVPKPSF